MESSAGALVDFCHFVLGSGYFGHLNWRFLPWMRFLLLLDCSVGINGGSTMFDRDLSDLSHRNYIGE